MAISLRINGIEIVVDGELKLPQSIESGQTYNVSFLGSVPSTKGTFEIITDGGVQVRSIVIGYTEDVLISGRSKHTYTLIDFGALLGLRPFDITLMGTISEVIPVALAAIGVTLTDQYAISADAASKQILYTIIGETLEQALPKILAATNHQLRYLITLTGELRIIEYGYGDTPPFQYITRSGGTISTANLVLNKGLKITPLQPNYGYIEVRGRNWMLASLTDGATNEGVIPVQKTAIESQNYYTELPKDHDLESVVLVYSTKTVAAPCPPLVLVPTSPIDPNTDNSYVNELIAHYKWTSRVQDGYPTPRAISREQIYTLDLTDSGFSGHHVKLDIFIELTSSPDSTTYPATGKFYLNGALTYDHQATGIVGNSSDGTRGFFHRLDLTDLQGTIVEFKAVNSVQDLEGGAGTSRASITLTALCDPHSCPVIILYDFDSAPSDSSLTFNFVAYDSLYDNMITEANFGASRDQKFKFDLTDDAFVGHNIFLDLQIEIAGNNPGGIAGSASVEIKFNGSSIYNLSTGAAHKLYIYRVDVSSYIGTVLEIEAILATTGTASLSSAVLIGRCDPTPLSNTYLLTATPSSNSFTQGIAGSFTSQINATSDNFALTNTVNLSLDALPADITASFDFTSTDINDSNPVHWPTLTINITGTTPAGFYTITVHGVAVIDGTIINIDVPISVNVIDSGGGLGGT